MSRKDIWSLPQRKKLSVSFSQHNDTKGNERILRALKQANGNRKVAAELLGIGRSTLYIKMEEYGLKYKFRKS